MRNPNDLHRKREPTEADGDSRQRLLKLLLAAEQRKPRQASPMRVARGQWTGPLPASYAQERLWFLDQLGLVGAAYNIPLTLRLSGVLVQEALQRSFVELVRRHESLRTRFAERDGQLLQLIEPSGPFELHLVDLTYLTETQQREGQLQELMRCEQLHRFDLRVGPPLRVVLVRLGASDHALLVTMHHIVSDGWSLGVLMQELSALYAAYAQGKASPLPELTTQYADFALWQRQWLHGDVLKAQLQYWRERLLGVSPQLQLPTDRPRPATESFKGAELRFELPAGLSKSLGELVQREGATLFMVLLAAYQLLLARWSGQQDIVVGSPIAGRRQRETEEVVGLFVNTLALRTEVSADLTLLKLLERVKEVTLGAYAHQDLPFDALVRELRPDRNLSRQPVFQVMLALQNYPEEHLDLTGMSWAWGETESVTAHFDQTLYLKESSRGISGILVYATDLFDRVTIERMVAGWQRLLEAMVRDIQQPISRVSLLTAAERERVLYDFNSTAQIDPRALLVHERFEEQVGLQPDAVAVVYKGQSLTYAEINARANQLARYLRRQGIGPDQLVGLCVERGVDMAVGVLGILKAGGAYVPLDPKHPADRLRYMLSDSAPKMLLIQEHLRVRVPKAAARVVALDRDWEQIAQHLETNLEAGDLRGHHLAYVIYTSGSTGTPKGVMVEHAGLSNYLHWAIRAYAPDSGEGAVVSSPLAFDATVTSFYCPLLSGRAVVLLAEGQELEGLERLLQQPRRWSLVKISPAHLQALGQRLLGARRPCTVGAFVIGGEALSASTVQLWRSIWPAVRLINEYGPTETVVGCSIYDIPMGWSEEVSVPIGHPIANTQIYLLDSHQQPVPIGVTGEIYIGGAGVARGYLNRPELTSERFLADPFGHGPQARMYRSGDLGRWRANGILEYLGRNDEQVKIRGYRIELGEVEVQLGRHAQVKDAVVIVREDLPGEKRLVAYVSKGEQTTLSVAALRAHLKSALPDYMVPSDFVMLEQLPLTPNGKLDRRALPMPQHGACGSQVYQAPEGEVEEALAKLWQDLLHLERIGRHENFFELGGHSLSAMKLVSQVAQRFGVPLSVIGVFQNPTVCQMAQAVQALRTTPGVDLAQSALDGGAALARAPLAFSQLAHWHQYELSRRPAVRQIVSAMRLQGRLDLEALQLSLLEIVRRHQALRTRIVVLEGIPTQEILAAADLDIKVEDFGALPDSLQGAEIRRAIDQQILKPLDVASEPLFAVRLLRIRSDEHVLIVALEHMISDWHSLSILVRELFTAYGQLSQGQAVSLPAIPVQFPHYAAAQRNAVNSWNAQHGAYWAERTAGCQRVRFPEDPFSALATRSGWGVIPIGIGPDLKAQWKEWCRQQKTTLVMGIFTAYVGLVLRWCHATDAIIAYQSDGRPSPAVHNTIGYFSCPLYLRVALRETDRFAELLTRVWQEYCNAQAHADAGYFAAQVPRPEWTRNSAFNWLPHGTAVDLSGPDAALKYSPIPFVHPMAEVMQIDYEPTISLFDTEDGGICAEVWFPLSRFSRTTMERFARSFVGLLEALPRQPDARFVDIPLLENH